MTQMTEQEEKRLLEETERGRQYAAKRFGLKLEEVVWHHSGICYNRVIVTTEEAAEKVRECVKGRTVNGGYLHGMGLGSWHAKQDGTFEVMC